MNSQDYSFHYFWISQSIKQGFGTLEQLVILDLLANGEKNYGELSQGTGLPNSDISQFLYQFRMMGMVRVRRTGQTILHALNGYKSYLIWSTLKSLILEHDHAFQNHVNEIHQKMGAPESIGLDRLAEISHALLLDVRPAKEYTAGHIPNAISIPIAELSERMSELLPPNQRPIVVYGRGTFCTFPYVAVQLIKSSGFHAIRLEASYPDYRLWNKETWE